jgi:adenosylcobinamide-phosphate synthase
MPIDFSFIGSPLWGSGERGLVFIFHSASELSEESFFILHSSFFILLFGWLLDLLLGDPAWLPHPVEGFGRAISFFEHRLNRGTHRKLKGALMAIALIIATYAIGLLFNVPMFNVPMFNVPMFNVQCSMFNVLIVFFCLAGTTLIREVRQVFLALDCSLDEGRKQVARIVGRDTSELSAQEVRTAALETLAENLSDGVIAPLFWFAILGVPGMLAYKMVNTLDSMIGYRTERYKDFGCWAAHIDDIANYIPARLTALLMILPYVIINCQLSIINFVRKYGRNHASPNSGYPEAALAGILNCRFGGPHYYFGELFDKPYIGENDRPLTTADMRIAIRVNRTAEVLMLLLVIAILIIRSIW